MNPNQSVVLSFPLDCLAAVGEVFGGQYSLPSGTKLSGVPTVLDIGANCGAFAIWARMTWQGCTVISYEPQPDVYAHLSKNLGQIPNTTAINAAVGDSSSPFLFRGNHSRLCSSQYMDREQSAEKISITVVEPRELPQADIVKIDAEGAEGYIIENLPFIPAALILEWHGAINRHRVEKALEGRMELCGAKLLSLDTGIYCYIKK